MPENVKLQFKIGPVPRGPYSETATYAMNDTVQTESGVYTSRRDGNAGHPVTDTDWWILTIDLSKVKEAKDAANAAAQRAEDGEAGRVGAEEARERSEGARVSAEASRASEEEKRAEAEGHRAEAERQRVSQESARETAEAARAAAETSRVTADQQRTAAETARATEFARLKTESQTATQTANTAAAEAKTQADRCQEFADDMDRTKKTLGHYSPRPNIVLRALETGVAISKAGVKVAKTGWAIAEFVAQKGNEYLFKPGTMDGDVCIFSEKITKEEIRNIDYAFTYDQNGRISKAVTTYGGQQHSYTFTYELSEEGSVVSETITDDQTGAIVAALPYQYKTSVGSYQPMTILNASAELPADGYCRLVSHFQNDTDLTVVVSYNTANADLNRLVVRDGFTASICTQLSNLAKRIANTTEYVFVTEVAVDTLRADVDGLLADVQTRTDFYEMPLLGGQPMKLFGAGTPQEAVVPDNWIGLDKGGFAWNGQPSMLGQEYINTAATSGGHYTAVRDGEYNLKWINS